MAIAVIGIFGAVILGSVISFADGHVEWRKWIESTTTPPLVPGQHLSNVPFPTSPNDRDMKWLTARTTVPASK